MRDKDRAIFADAAQVLQVWILVRETNPASLPYVERGGYVPKPMECKAKTADLDRGGKLLAGLVVSPEIWPDAYKSKDKERSALDCWKKFKAQCLGKATSPWGVNTDRNAVHYGCVTRNGKYVHGDYDLKDIIVPGHESCNIAVQVDHGDGVIESRGVGFSKVRDYVNPRIGSPMVQHGAEAQYGDHSEDVIDVFSPDGDAFRLEGQARIDAWYREQAGGIGRLTLGKLDKARGFRPGRVTLPEKSELAKVLPFRRP